MPLKQRGTSKTKAKPLSSQVTASSLPHSAEPSETPHPSGLTMSTDTWTGRPRHTNAGTGGRLAQLEKIGQAIEGMPEPPRSHVTVPDGKLVNAMAPTPRHPKRRKVTSNPLTEVCINTVYNCYLTFCNLGIDSGSSHC